MILPNPNNLPCVNHKDQNTKNNNLEKILCQALNILVENNLLNYYNINIQTSNDKTNTEHNESFTINLKLKNQYMNDFIERKGVLW